MLARPGLTATLGPSIQLVLALLALAVVVLGCAPNLLIGRLVAAIKLAGL